MADIDFLALMGQGSESWNLWRADHPKIRPNLSQAYLFGQVLGEFDLSNTNLERACLIGTNLRGANLQGSCLESVYASGADLTGANLDGADLSRSNFSEACFDEANLSTAKVAGTNFSNASFSGACLSRWDANKTTILSGLRGTHVYLAPQRRSPTKGEFGPEDLTALLAQPKPQFQQNKRSGRSGLVLGAIQNSPWLAGFGGLSAIAAIALITVSLQPKSANSTSSDAEQSLPSPPVAEDFVSLPCNEGQPPAQLIAAVGYEYEDGTLYYGNFAEGQPADGRGTLVYPSKNRYDGEFKDGQRNGCGTFTFSNGRRYIGQFEADQFSGKGTWILENGERYIGEFKNNKCSGKGTFIFTNGSSKSGIWQAGKLLDGTLSCDQGGMNLPTSPGDEAL